MNTPWSRLSSQFFDQAPVLRLFIPFALGILLAEWGVFKPEALPYIIITACGLTISCILLLLWRKNLSTWLSDKFFASMIFAIVLCLGFFKDTLFYHSLSASWPRTPCQWQGIVSEPCKSSPRTIRTTLLLYTDGDWHRVALTIKREAINTTPVVGEAISFKSKIAKPTSKSHHSGFDYALWLRQQGIEGTAFVSTPISFLTPSETKELTDKLPPLTRLRIKAHKLRHRLVERYKVMAVGDMELSLLSAITLGDKTHLTKHTRSVFSNAGISHILALSGLHLGILTMFLMMLLRPLRLYRWSQWIMVVASIGLIWSFAILTGLSVSVVRSASMLSLLLLLSLRGEGYSSLNNVVLAALLILLIRPTCITDLSFQLSFLSVGALICFMPQYQESALRQKMGKYKFALDFVYVSLVAQLATAPLVALAFGQLPTYFLLANAIAIPCTYVVLIGALGFALMGHLAIIGEIISWITAKSTSLLLWWANWVSSLPCSTFTLHLTPISCTLAYISLFFAAWWLTLRNRDLLYLAMLAAGLCLSAIIWEI